MKILYSLTLLGAYLLAPVIFCTYHIDQQIDQPVMADCVKEEIQPTILQSIVPLDPAVHIVLDLGGVCLETNKGKAARILGIWNLMKYMMGGYKPKNIKEKLYGLLRLIQLENLEYSQGQKDPDGDELPPLLVSFFHGDMTGHHALQLIKNAMKDYPDFFCTGTEKKLVAKLAKIIFHPPTLADTRLLINGAEKFVQTCREKGYRLSVLSNWDHESFQLLRQEYRSFFDLFDHLYVSGSLGCSKPDSTIYRHCVDPYPNDLFIFFDDQEENLLTASAHGMYGVLIPPQPTASLWGSGSKNHFTYLHQLIDMIILHEKSNATGQYCHQSSCYEMAQIVCPFRNVDHARLPLLRKN